MKRCCLLYCLLVASFLLACSPDNNSLSPLATEVVSVPILNMAGFEWHSVGETNRYGEVWGYEGGACDIPLSMDGTVEELQRTLTPEDGWILEEVDERLVTLRKHLGDENVLIYVSPGRTDTDSQTISTNVTVQSGVWRE